LGLFRVFKTCMAETDETPKSKSLRTQLTGCEIKTDSGIGCLVDTPEDDRVVELGRKALPFQDLSNSLFSPIQPEENAKTFPSPPSDSSLNGPDLTQVDLLNLDQTLETTFDEQDENKFAGLLQPENEIRTILQKDDPPKRTNLKRSFFRAQSLHLATSPSKIKRLKSKIRSHEEKTLRSRIPTPVFSNEIQRPRSCIPLLDTAKDGESEKLSVQQVARLLKGPLELTIGEKTVKFSKMVIVDARYKYEYEGGHIKDAVSIPKEVDEVWRGEISHQFFKGDRAAEGANTVVIFHCEFSSKRGPAMKDWFREHDRGLNLYPALYYPHVFLMEGGYKQFYNTFKDQPETSQDELFCPLRGYVDELCLDFSDKNKSIRKRKKKHKHPTRTDTRSNMRKLRSTSTKDTGTPTKEAKSLYRQ